MRLRAILACALVPLLLFAGLPLVSQGEVPLQERIDRAQEKIKRKKGTERVLTSDIAVYTRRIRRLQGDIGGLQRRQAAVQRYL